MKGTRCHILRHALHDADRYASRLLSHARIFVNRTALRRAASITAAIALTLSLACLPASRPLPAFGEIHWYEGG